MPAGSSRNSNSTGRSFRRRRRNQELVELRAELCDKQAKESKGGLYSTFDFGHPAVMAIRSAENAAMVRRANLWNEFKDGWLEFSFSGIDPGYVANSRDRRTGEMVLEGVLMHVSDGIRRPAKLRIPDNDAERLAILMGSEYGHGRCGRGMDASA